MADKEIGVRLTADDQVSPSVKSIKQQLREAQNEVIKLTEQFGATSKEASAAATKAADLKEQILQSKKLVDTFNPAAKFNAFAQSLTGVAGGFSALTGAMGLLGIESKDVQEQLLKVQSAMAITQGLNTIGESIQSFENLGSTLVKTLGKSGLIGIAIAGVAALGAALLGAFDGPSKKVEELNNSIEELRKAEADAGKEVKLLKESFEQARLGIISKKDALDEYNKGLGKTIGEAKDLNEAEKLTADNAEAYIKVQGLKAQANYLLAQSSKLEAEARVEESKLNQVQDNYIVTTFGIKSRVHADIEQKKKDASDLQSLIAGINTEMEKASKGFKQAVDDPDKTKTKSPKVKAAKKEEEDITFAMTTEFNLRIQAHEDMLAKMAQNKANFVEIGKGIDEQEKADQAKRDAEAAQASIDLANQEKENKLAAMDAVANGLSSLSDLVGEHTAAGKVLAIAAATINTFKGASEALGSAPPPYNFIMMAAVIAAGLVQIKKIISVKIPKHDKGGSAPSAGSIAAPLQPKIPVATNTILDQGQINQIGNATVKAFVVESDISNNQERITRLNRAARIG